MLFIDETGDTVGKFFTRVYEYKHEETHSEYHHKEIHNKNIKTYILKTQEYYGHYC